eukprot:CAMPEP_0177662528 /NCGR_PEP_ID=MMETSP0447-20121125/19348_1 /TAXON_ID=0 /ORGANISM="Stygamoeba regulata, Strain BSH-02190019" /LENGTH=93 /DNA_ID=CAMNT_0019168119 /DNA_START=238 /DNA_END=520 /DNA_ORIENTATION=+
MNKIQHRKSGQDVTKEASTLTIETPRGRPAGIAGDTFVTTKVQCLLEKDLRVEGGGHGVGDDGAGVAGVGERKKVEPEQDESRQWVVVGVYGG